MTKKELLEHLSNFKDEDIVVIPLSNGKVFERINKVWNREVTVRNGKIHNGMQNKLEYCGEIEGSFKAIVLES
jgi:hypothetical protein